MQTMSRRTVLRDLGWLAAAGTIAAPPLWSGNNHLLLPGTGTLPPPTASDLFLIFTGAWILSFDQDGQHINMLTPDCDDHIYDYSVNPVAQPKPTPVTIPPGQSYEVTVQGFNSASDPSTLIQDMVNNNEGLIFYKDKVTLNTNNQVNLRRVKLPMPSYIHTDALVSGHKINNLDPSVSRVPSPVAVPTVYALIYSGAWQSATIKDSNGNSVPISPCVQVSSSCSNHVRFRVCQKGFCDTPNPTQCDSKIDCAKLTLQEEHARMVFCMLMGMLDFPDGIPKPSISFTPCSDQNANLKVCKGKDKYITPDEVGMPSASCIDCGLHPLHTATNKSIFYANLHNCASAGIIVGA
jgi:hypothetical protein